MNEVAVLRRTHGADGELHQFICCEPADHRLAFECGERNERLAS